MKISVAICTYNGEKYLQAQIDSILNQNQKVDEIIVCDDISTDNTLVILDEYAKKHPNLFTIIRNETNLRSVKNFEKAISLATGDYIFLADQDDIWLESKVDKMIHHLKQKKECLGLFSDGFLFQHKKNTAISLWESIYFNPTKIQHTSELYFYTIFKRNVVTGAALCIKKEAKEFIFPFPNLKGFHHDHWIAYILSERNQLDFMDEKLFYYRLHENQQVGTKIKKSRFKELKNNQINKALFSDQKVSFLFKNKIRKTLNNNLELYKSLLNISETNSFKNTINSTIAIIQNKIKSI